MRKLFLLSVAILSLLFSCGKMEDPDLGAFKRWEPYLDMSLQNKFDESLFCKQWVYDKVYTEVYIDGVKWFQTDHTNDVVPWPNLAFGTDHSMSYGGIGGEWLYSHNYLMWQMPAIDIFSFFGEVLNVTDDSLTLRGESVSSGQEPFFKDKSGTHYFSLLELKAK